MDPPIVGLINKRTSQTAPCAAIAWPPSAAKIPCAIGVSAIFPKVALFILVSGWWRDWARSRIHVGTH